MKKLSRKIIAGISSVCVLTSAVPSITGGVYAADTAKTETVYGDTNLDGEVTIADSVAILQYLANSDEYGLSAQALDNADVELRGNGVNTSDALAIQKLDAKVIETLPESWADGGQTGTGTTTGGSGTATTTTDSDTPQADITYIHLADGKTTVDGNNATVSGDVVTIIHSGTYYLDGTLSDGQIKVSVPDETVDAETVKIYLNGVNITGKSAPAIYVENAENTSINLVDGTENKLSDGDTAYSGDWLECAVIEAKDDITIKGGTEGTGTLNITANTQDGIVCNNDIKFTGGITTITTLNTVDENNAVKGKKSVTVKDGTLNIEAEGDGIKSSKGNVAVQGGLLNIKAGNDAIQAETTIDISGGTVIAGGDEGLTSVTGTNITGGTVIATATDEQTDLTLMSGTTQGTMLLNCIESSETDGCWKKAESITTGDIKAYKWMKKYRYVILSDASIKSGSKYTLTNQSSGNSVQHSGGAEFSQTDVVTVYNEVNPAGVSGSTGGNTDTPTGANAIALSGTSISSSADGVTVKDGVATISKAGVYEVSGEAKNVQIEVNVDKTTYPDAVVELDFVGADISNDTTAPIYVSSIGNEVQIVAKSGTENAISDGTSHTQTYTDSDGNTNTVEGAVFARDDIKFKGTGNLTINGNTDDAVVCKNDIKIYNGNITVNAVNDGIRGKDSVIIGNDEKADGSAVDYSTLKLTVNTKSGDGIKSTSDEESTAEKAEGEVEINGGTVNINSYADGIQAEQEFVMNGGDVTIYTYEGSTFGGTVGGSTGGNQFGGFGGGFGGGMQEGNSNKSEISAKGIKAVGVYDSTGTTWQDGGDIEILGGNLKIDSSDDSIHAGGEIEIEGGKLLLASADDAVHSDHDLTLGEEGGANSDFEIYVTKCYEGVEGNNIYQYSGTVVVKSDDDGYNAAGGADNSGSGNNMGWGQGGFGGGMGGSSGNILQIDGGVVIVQSASGDHDGIDSNGNVNITGGIVIANGQETIDCGDGYSENITGGTIVECSSQGAGSIQAGTQFTVADESGNVIVSFTTMQAMGSPSMNNTSLKCYTGGTISGGADLITTDDSMEVYTNGTISGGTAVSAGTSSGNQGGFGGFGGRSF